LIAAVNCELFTKVVERALPFQFTTEVEAKPVPFTVRVKPAAPGKELAGTSGWLISGTGLCPTAVETSSPAAQTHTAILKKLPGVRVFIMYVMLLTSFLSMVVPPRSKSA